MAPLNINIQGNTSSSITELTSQEVESRYNDILEALPSGVVVHDSKGIISSYNKRALEILGVSEELFAGKFASDISLSFYHPDGSAFPAEEHPAISSLKTGKPYKDVEMIVQRNDTSRIYLSINAQPLFRQNEDKPYSVVTSFNDITTEKENEHVLAERSQFFKAIYDNADVSIWITRVNKDGSFDLIDNNPADYAVTGNKFSIQDPVSLDKGYPGFALAQVLENYRRCVRLKKNVSFEEKIIHENVEKWFLSTLTPITNAENDVVMVIGTAKEITEKKSKEIKLLNLQSNLKSKINIQHDEIKQKENLYRLIGQNFPDGDIFIIDENQTILIAEGTEILKKYNQPLEGNSICSVFSGEACMLLNDALKDVFKDKIVEYEYSFNSWEYQMKLVPVKDEKNNIDAALCVSQNITRLNNATRHIHQVLKTESALSRASRILLSGDYSLSTIHKALKVILDSTQISRIYIFENFTKKSELYCRQIAEVCLDGVKSEIDNPELQNVKYNDSIKRWKEILKNKQSVSGFVKDFPDQEKEILQPQGIKSVLVLPIFINMQFWGFIGFDDVYREREWDQNHIYLLSTLADALGSHISNEKTNLKLRFEQERYEKLANSITDTFYSTDRNFRIQFWNKAAEKLTHQPKANIIGKKLSDFFPGENVKKLHAIFKKCLHTGKTSDITIDWMIKDEMRNFEVRIYPFSDGLAVLVKEITDRIKTEKELLHNQSVLKEQKIALENKNKSLTKTQEELKNSRNRYFDLYENAPTGFFTLNNEGRILEANKTMLRMIGENKHTLQANLFTEILHPDDIQIFNTFLNEIVKKKDVSAIEARLLWKNKAPIYVAISSSKMKKMHDEFKFTATDISRLKEAQKEVEKNEIILASLIRHLPVELFVLDQKNKIFIQNKRSKDRWGDFYGFHLDQIPIPDSLRQSTTRALSGNQQPRGHYETVYFTHEGADIVYEQIFSKIQVHHEFIGNLCILIDVSDERKMEAEILQVREDTIKTIETILKFLPNGLLIFDENMQLLRDNETYRKIIEAYASQLKFSTAALDRLIQQRVISELESGNGLQIIIYEKDDSRNKDKFLALDITDAVIQENGEKRLLISIKDSTSQLKAIREIEEKERLYNTLANNIPDTDIYVVDKALNYLLADGKLKDKYGFDTDFFQGRCLYDLTIEGEVWMAVKEMYVESLKGKTVSREFFYVKDYFDVTTLPLLDNNNEVFAIMGIFRQITRLKETQLKQQRLINKEREINLLRSRFLSTMSHEFRTPLSVISTTVQLLEKMPDLLKSDRKYDLLTRMNNAASFMVSILDDINFISLDQSDRLQFNPTKTNVNVFCKQIIQEVKFSMPNKHIDFQYAGGETELFLDIKLMRHILTNVLNNAVKYSLNSKKPVEFMATGMKNQLKLEIRDYGIGMSQEEIKQVFEPFYRATKVEKIKGTGLGMSIVKRCVDLHQGEIDITSKPGKGTVVLLQIPVTNKELK